MDLKRHPDDFRVVEELEFERSPRGVHHVHLLRKEKMDTLEAVSIIAREAKVPRETIAFAGLKDRQGCTEQWISIQDQKVDLRMQGLSVRFVARSDQPVTSKLSQGNRFEIVVRDLSEMELEDAGRSLSAVAESGYANYFDDQRFGCLQHGQGFAMYEILTGRYDRALHRLLARPSRVARSGDVKLKRLFARHWGDWEACGRIVRGPLYRGVFDHLRAHPDDFRGALAALPTRFKLIHAFAYQSFLWNRAVARLLYRTLRGHERRRTRNLSGELTVWGDLRPDRIREIHAFRTPLCGAGGRGGDREFRAAMRQVFEDEGLPIGALERQDVPGMEIREEDRAIAVVPRNLKMSRPFADDSFRGRSCVTLSFGLPRGSYATMLIKRLFLRNPRRGGPSSHSPRKSRDS